ncbi:MAG: hypothetical protein ABI743_15180 [bacterium]
MTRPTLRSIGLCTLSTVFALQVPGAALANITPPSGGGNGRTLTGVVVDPPRNEGDEGNVEEGAETNTQAAITLGVAVGLLAWAVSDQAGGTPTVLSDCESLFSDLFDNQTGEAVRSGDCAGSRSSAALFAPLAMAAISVPDKSIGAGEMQARIADTVMQRTGASNAVDALTATGKAGFSTVGQPLGTTVKISLDKYLMAGKEYPVTFTISAAPGSDLSQPLYLCAGDLANAGHFTQQIGFPFAIPVDMEALRANGSWTFTTPYETEAGSYFLDGYLSPGLARQLRADTRGFNVIDSVQQQLAGLDKQLSRKSHPSEELVAERAAVQQHLMWLMEWSRQLP